VSKVRTDTFLLYAAFPEGPGAVYNSNSFVSGILKATTGVMPPPPVPQSTRQPPDGFLKPVPEKYFR
jgi:hypothetical protein